MSSRREKDPTTVTFACDGSRKKRAIDTLPREMYEITTKAKLTQLGKKAMRRQPVRSRMCRGDKISPMYLYDDVTNAKRGVVERPRRSTGVAVPRRSPRLARRRTAADALDDPEAVNRLLRELDEEEQQDDDFDPLFDEIEGRTRGQRRLKNSTTTNKLSKSTQSEIERLSKELGDTMNQATVKRRGPGRPPKSQRVNELIRKTAGARRAGLRPVK